MKILTKSEWMIRGGIYCITNTVNNKRYVGSTFLFKKRFTEHRKALRAGKHHSILLQRAFNKHGENSFTFQVLLVCDQKDCLLYEQLLLDGLRTHDPALGYNICPTAGNSAGRPVTDALRANMSKAKKGVPYSPEARANMRKGMLGKKRGPFSVAHREAMSKARLGVKHSPERAAAAAKARTGLKRSASTKAKISQAQLGREMTTETRAKIGQANRGRKLAPFSPERIARMTEANRKSAEKKRLAKLTS